MSKGVGTTGGSGRHPPSGNSQSASSGCTPHFTICPPIRLLDRPNPAPGGMSLNVSGPRSQPCLHWASAFPCAAFPPWDLRFWVYAASDLIECWT